MVEVQKSNLKKVIAIGLILVLVVNLFLLPMGYVSLSTFWIILVVAFLLLQFVIKK